MKVNDTVKAIMSQKNMTQGEFTKILGVKSQSGVSAALNRDMRVSTLANFLRVLGCELVIRDTSTGEEHIVSE